MPESDRNRSAPSVEAKRPGIRPLPVHFAAALIDNAQRLSGAAYQHADFVRMVDGMQKYLAHPYERMLPPLENVWTAGEARMLFSPAEGDAIAAPSLLLIPSMINRSYILDLMPGRSFARWLSAQGINVYILDWGNAADDPALGTMDEVLDRLLGAARFIGDTEGGAVHALGYCMGGTLLAAAASLRPENFQSLVFLASPWDFEAGDEMLTKYVQAGTPQALQLIERAGRLEVQWIQSLFAAVNADRTVQKFMDFVQLEPDSAKAHLFVAVEDWLNDSIDLPGEVARQCVVDWYGENKPFAGRWMVAGIPVDLSRAAMPALIIGSARDRLVPLPSSLAMREKLARAEILTPEIGHIGMMTGSRACKLVWEPVLNWLESHN